MKIGALDSSLRKPLAETVRKFAEMGLQGIQIRIRPEFLAFPETRLDVIRALCADHGLTISAVCGDDMGSTRFGVRDEWQDRVFLAKAVTDIAVKLRTRVITTHIGVVPDDRNDEVYGIMVRALKECAAYAAAKDAVFAVETGPEKPETLLNMLHDVDSRGLGVNLDPANLRMVTCVDPAHAVEVLGKYIVHTHAKDGINITPGCVPAHYKAYNADGSLRVFDEPGPKRQEVPLGQGQVPWDSYLAALGKAGYDGFLTIERECGTDPEGDIFRAKNFLMQKLERRRS